MDCDFVFKVLDIVSETDGHGYLWWRTDGDYAPVTFMVECNDVFEWALADCVRLMPENLSVLEQAIKDCQEISGESGWGTPGEAYTLFCCRVREMRPQGVVYKDIDKELWPLFDACGPVREVDMHNPSLRPD